MIVLKREKQKPSEQLQPILWCECMVLLIPEAVADCHV
jgi:hypothetical protein